MACESEILVVIFSLKIVTELKNCMHHFDVVFCEVKFDYYGTSFTKA